MINVLLGHSDGQYQTRQLSDKEAAEWREAGHTVVCVRDSVWAAWQAHLAQDAVFDALWTALDNAEWRGE